ncbi:MAG: aminopeptidase P family protein [Lachnospiraceae bacterium]|nr:aminopeptidase P family protein [Lachnospiraceae bacterium]
MKSEHLQLLRQQMKDNGIDLYVIPLSDYHMSEYVGDHFKGVEWISGFSGTNATLVASQEEAGMWTDGRYFIQARQQMEGSGVKLFEMGEEGVPTVEAYIEHNLKKGQTLGYDGRVFSVSWDHKMMDIAEKKEANVEIGKDLLEDIWTDRPSLPAKKVWILSQEYAGQTMAQKVARIREKMKEEDCSGHILTSLYDIAWLFNLRGDDIPCVPVFLSYVYLTMDSITLYANPEIFDDEVKAYLKEQGVELRPYVAIYEDLAGVQEKRILADVKVVNAALCGELPVDAELVDADNPSDRLKSIKNETEIRNTKQAHIHDGVAVTRFIYWLKHHVGKEKITEMDAADRLLAFRQEQEHFLDISFDTISAYGENAALMHYEPGRDHEVELLPKSFLLVDSGGHYLEGTTDITRTIALGELTDWEKEAFTLVLRSHLRLLSAHFPKGTAGVNLDILARGPLWDRGLDYRCGTGHGVGHILNVHEGPNSFRWRVENDEARTHIVPGQITTDEPGLYFEGEFGIRTESELLCVEDEKTEYGQFYCFENLTFCPIDLDAIVPELLTQYEKAELNAYHANCYETLAPLLPPEEAKWLKEVTRAI